MGSHLLCLTSAPLYDFYNNINLFLNCYTFNSTLYLSPFHFWASSPFVTLLYCSLQVGCQSSPEIVQSVVNVVGLLSGCHALLHGWACQRMRTYVSSQIQIRLSYRMPANYSVDLRWRAIWLFLIRKMSYADIAHVLLMSTRSVQRYVELYQSTGAVEPRKQNHGPEQLLTEFANNCAPVNDREAWNLSH